MDSHRIDDSGLSLEALDVQSRTPGTRISLSRVGVTGVEKIITISADAGKQLYHAQLECFVDLNPQQTGVHMSRFQEVVNEAIDDVIMQEAFKAETLAAHIAERVRERQGGLRAEVTIRARYPEHKRTPVSGKPTQELYTLIGTAVISDRGLRRLVGVEAQGITACPCAQELVADSARERLVEQGFTDDEIERVLDSVPIATHNQRGIGTLCVGCPEECDIEIKAETLLRIVEDSMSSEIFELLKRPDERAIVEKAHSRPRFVEDCVREMVRGLVAARPDLDDQAFVAARQENLETIHQHSVVAERHGLLGEIRAELDADEHSRRHVTMREWLELGTTRDPR
jgi:GTP cyclohydrolase I/GTP cyclohydrolase-4